MALTNWQVDKTKWPQGPWDAEPDRIQWTTQAGYVGLAVRNSHFGNWCGYVGVPQTHPYHGKHYDQVNVSAHGGLTYSDYCREDTPICHVPAPGEPEELYWFGFDCAHFRDYAPGLDRILAATLNRPVREPNPDETYRDLAYVQGEVEDLARQLKEVADAPRDPQDGGINAFSLGDDDEADLGDRPADGADGRAGPAGL